MARISLTRIKGEGNSTSRTQGTTIVRTNRMKCRIKGEGLVTRIETIPNTLTPTKCTMTTLGIRNPLTITIRTWISRQNPLIPTNNTLPIDFRWTKFHRWLNKKKRRWRERGTDKQRNTRMKGKGNMRMKSTRKMSKGRNRGRRSMMMGITMREQKGKKRNKKRRNSSKRSQNQKRQPGT